MERAPIMDHTEQSRYRSNNRAPEPGGPGDFVCPSGKNGAFDTSVPSRLEDHGNHVGHGDPAPAVDGRSDTDWEGSGSGCAARDPQEGADAESARGLTFVGDDSSFSAFMESIGPDDEEEAGGPEEGQQKGQGHDEGTPEDGSEATGGGSRHPLAKVCVEEGEDGPEGFDFWRRKRYARREALWRVTEVQRCAYCGRVPYSDVQYEREEKWKGGKDGELVNVRAKRREGVQTCRNVHLCPVCAVGPRRERASMINEAVRTHLDREEGQVVEMLLTLKHDRSHGLRQQMEAMKAGWDELWRSWDGRKLKEEMGVEGYYWATEAPWNVENGWNVHRHAVLFTSKTHDAQEISEIREDLYDLYRDAVQEAGMPCPSIEWGVRMEVIEDEEDADDLGGYLTKMESRGEATAGDLSRAIGAGEEVARGDEKGGRKGLMPFEMLDRMVQAWESLEDARGKLEELEHLRAAGDEVTTTWAENSVEKAEKELGVWVRLWREYERVVQGETMMQASQLFEDKLCSGLDEGEEEGEDDVQTVVKLLDPVPAHLYRHVASMRGGIAALEEAVEGNGRIRRSGNRISSVGEGESVDFEGFVEALRLDWLLSEEKAPVGEAPQAGSNT